MLEGLQLGVGVRADFAVEVDLFVLRSNPFHEQCSLRKFNDKRQDSTGAWKEEEGNPSGWAGLACSPVTRRRPQMSVCTSRSRTLGIDFAAPREHNLSR